MEHFPAYPYKIQKVRGIHEGYDPRSEAASPDALSDAAKPVSGTDEIKQLRHEVDYLKQEMEFLKKFPQSELQGSRYTAHERFFLHI